MADKEVEALIKFTLDDSGAKKAVDASENLDKNLKGSGDGAKNATKSINDMAKTAGNLAALAGVAAGIGLSFGAIVKGADAYSKSVGTTTATSREWLYNQQKIADATTQIQGSYTAAIIPAQKIAADFLTKFSSFTQQNPWFVKASTAVLAGVGVGTFFKTAQTVSSIIGKFGGASVIGSTAATEGGAAVESAAAGGGISALISPLGALIAAVIALVALLNTKFGQQGVTAGEQILTMAAGGAGTIAGTVTGNKNLGAQWANSTGQALGVLPTSGGANGQGQLQNTDQQLEIYAGYYKQQLEAQRQYTIQMGRTSRDYQLQEIYAYQDFYKSRSRELRDFNIDQTNAENDYYRQRTIASRDFNISIQRDEQDHQIQMQRMQQDYQFSLFDILRSGDAMAYMRANYEYNLQVSRANQDYQIQESRKSSDFARTLQDNETQYQIERSRSIQEFNIKLKDEDQDFKIERDRAAQQYEIQLSDAQQNYQEQQLAQRQALQDQLNDLVDGETKRTLLYRQFTQIQLTDLQNAIAAAQKTPNLYASGTLGSRASGGYVNYGTYLMHPGEFVLNRSTTQAAENRAGGGLSQDTVLGLISGRSGGSKTGTYLTYSDHRTFSGDYTPSMRAAIQADTENIISEMLRGVNV